MTNQPLANTHSRSASSFLPGLHPTAGGISPTSVTSCDRLLRRFDTISLKQMDGIALLNRTDTKYVLQTVQLQEALAQLTDRYRVLKVKGKRLNHYQTVYFDTPYFTLYTRHHDGYRNRYKVRSREYVDSHKAFLEVKFKTNKNRTIKSRLQTPDVVTELDSQTVGFIHAHYPTTPKCSNPSCGTSFCVSRWSANTALSA